MGEAFTMHRNLIAYVITFIIMYDQTVHIYKSNMLMNIVLLIFTMLYNLDITTITTNTIRLAVRHQVDISLYNAKR